MSRFLLLMNSTDGTKTTFNELRWTKDGQLDNGELRHNDRNTKIQKGNKQDPKKASRWIPMNFDELGWSIEDELGRKDKERERRKDKKTKWL